MRDYLGKNISEICTNGFHDKSLNHCAHFVGHAKSFAKGYTCSNQTGKTGPASTIRVQDVFYNCTSVGTWDSKKGDVLDCLIFITKAGEVNITTQVMNNIPKKHIGVFTQGLVFHYSNSKDKVVSQSVDDFKHHYSSPYNDLFYGVI